MANPRLAARHLSGVCRDGRQGETGLQGMPAATRRLAFGAGNMYIADTPFRKMPAPPPLIPM